MYLAYLIVSKETGLSRDRASERSAPRGCSHPYKEISPKISEQKHPKIFAQKYSKMCLKYVDTRKMFLNPQIIPSFKV